MQNEALQQQQALEPLQGSVASELKYGDTTALSIPAVKTERKYRPENSSTFTPTNNVVRIPVSSHEFLDLSKSRLAFDFTNTSTPACCLDGGANAHIQMMRVMSPQMVEIERIEGYNLVNAIELKWMSKEEDLRELSAMEGTQSSLDCFYPTADGSPATMEKRYNAKQALKLTQNKTVHFECRLRGAWFNSHLKKLLPPGVGFLIELTLAPANECMVIARKEVFLTQRNSHFTHISVSGGATVTDSKTAADTVQMLNHGFADNDVVRVSLGGSTASPSAVVDNGKIQIRSVQSNTFKIQTDAASPTAITWTNADASNTLITADGTEPVAFALDDNSATLSYTVQNYEFIVPAVRIEDPSFQSRVSGLQQQGYAWTGTTYKRYVNQITNGIGEKVVQVSDRSYALDGFFSVLRASTRLSHPSQPSLSVSSVQYVRDYQLQIGSNLYPPHKVEIESRLAQDGTGCSQFGNSVSNKPGGVSGLNVGEAYAQCKQLFGHGRGLIDIEAFAQSELNHGSGILCISTKAFDHDGTRLLSGLDTKSPALPITFKMFCHSAPIDGVSASDVFGRTGTGASESVHTGELHTYAVCTIQFSIQAGTGLVESST